MRTWFNAHTTLSESERADFDATIETVPEYPCESVEDMGSFGNMTTILCLAGFLGLNVVCWNKKTLRNKSARQQCVEFSPTQEDPQAPGAATDPPDRARMMVTGWGVNSLFTPINSQLQAVP